jgi:membrane protein
MGPEGGMVTAKDLVSLAKQSFDEWMEDQAPKEAAALAYYTLLSAPALLLFIQWILGQVVSEQVQSDVIAFVQGSVRGGGAEAIKAMIESADRSESEGRIATIVSLATLAISATGIVTHLEHSLNRMWEIAEDGVGIAEKLRQRFTSLLIVLILGGFLLVSVSLSTVVSGFAENVRSSLGLGEWTIQGGNIALSLLLLTFLFSGALKTLPSARVAWTDVWLGGAATAVLFVLGQYALSLYLGKSAPGSAYGVAGSVVAFAVWTYYSALILFLGAEFTQVYANRFGSHIRLEPSAVPLEQKVHEEQAHPGREPADDVGEIAVMEHVHDTEDRSPVSGSENGGDRASAATTRPTVTGDEEDESPEPSRRVYEFIFGLLAIGVAAWLSFRRSRNEAP